MLKYIVDKDVIFDALRDNDAEDIKIIFRNAARKRINLYITPDIIRDIISALQEEYDDPTIIGPYMQKLILCIKICSVFQDECLRAIATMSENYEASLMIQLSDRYGVDGIISNDIKKFEKEKYKVITPHDVAEKLKSENLT